MLPVSLSPDSSIAPNSCVVPWGRRKRMSLSVRAELTGKMTRVRPVRSPSMCIITAAMASSACPSNSGTSSKRRMLTRGTEIMMRLLTICPSAVAAWPAPILATSRSASSCRACRSRTSSMVLLLHQRRSVEDQRRHAISQDRSAREEREHPPRRFEWFDHDLLLSYQRIRQERGASVAHLQDDAGTPGRRRTVELGTEQLAEVDRRDHLIPEDQRIGALQHRPRLRRHFDGLGHGTEGERVALRPHPGQE